MSDILSEVLANPLVGMVGNAIAIAAVTLWLAAAWWAYGDSSRRSESRVAPLAAAAWIVLSTPLMLPLSLAIYGALRPQQTVGERHDQQLMLELDHAVAFGQPDCDACGASIQSDWLRCPMCATWLAAPCAHCGRLSSSTLEACPFCGDESTRVAPHGPAGHEKAAASEAPAAAIASTPQRRIASSLRPASYAASRESSSASL